jgi:hypothetical protein
MSDMLKNLLEEAKKKQAENQEVLEKHGFEY